MPIPSSPGLTGRSLLRDDVYLRLRDAIIDGTLQPGEILKDGELAQWLGVSRTPVREALLRLAASGLVVARPGRSTVVAALEEADVRAARDVTAAMHALAARLGVPTLQPTQLAAMEQANRQFTAAVDAGDGVAAIAADDAFHNVLVTASGNPAISAVLDQYEPVLRRAEFLRFLSADRLASADRHARLIGLCAAGDTEGASALAFQTWHSLPVGQGRATEDGDPQP